MINNKTQQQTTVNNSTVSESNIYLKKSELPKDISSFRNDVGYISASALSTWLKEHSYLSKSEINALIKKSNLTIVDSINKSLDDDAIARLNQDVVDIKGEIVAIKDRLDGVETGYISVDKASGFATKTDVRNLSNKITNIIHDISNIDVDTTYFATKDDIPTKVSQLQNDANYLTKHQSLAKYAKKTDIPDVSVFVTREEIPSVDGLASKEWVESKGYLTSHQSLSGYAKKSDIPNVSNLATKDEIPSVDGLASKEWVESKGYLTSHQSLTGYAKKSDLPDVSKFITEDDIPSVDGLATKDWVEGKGYLTSHQSLAGYAKKSDLPDLTPYVTEQWIQEQGFITEIEDLDKYAKKTDLSGFLTSSDLTPYAKKNSVYDKNYIDNYILSKSDAQLIYPTKSDADNKYLSKTDARKEYLKIEDYVGIKDATVINKEYNEKTIEDLEEDINLLRNGFYIVHYNDIVIVEDHKILRFFADGVPQTVLEWIEEE